MRGGGRGRGLGQMVYLYTAPYSRRRIKTEIKAKVVIVIWGRYLNVLGWWFGMVCTGWSSTFSKHPFRQVAFILFILLFKFILVKVRQGIESIPSWPKLQQRPLPSFHLYLSSYAHCTLTVLTSYRREANYVE